MNIFISYGKSDVKFVELLKNKLSDSGYYFFDSSMIKPGEDWYLNLKNEIDSADVILIVLSNESLNSQRVTFEISCTMADKYNNKKENKIIIPIMIEELEEVPFFIGNIRFLDFSDHKKGIDDIESLKSLLRKRNVINKKMDENIYERTKQDTSKINEKENFTKVELIHTVKEYYEYQIMYYYRNQLVSFLKSSFNIIRLTLILLVFLYMILSTSIFWSLTRDKFSLPVQDYWGPFILGLSFFLILNALFSDKGKILAVRIFNIFIAKTKDEGVENEK